MEFLIEMKIMNPGLKLKGIQADNIEQAQEQIVALVLLFHQIPFNRHWVKMIGSAPHVREFYINFEGRQKKILVYNPKKVEIV